MYASEDYLDQEICKMGRERGLDIIVLTHMIGMYQVVTEILDCRNRDISFQRLLFVD